MRRFFKDFAKINKPENTATAANPAVAGFDLKVRGIFLLAAIILVIIMFCTSCSAAPDENAEKTPQQIAAETAQMIDDWVPAEINMEERSDRLIAHGGAAVDGYCTSNSAEAVMNAADHGYSLVELDFNMTSDDHVVLVHDWDATTTYYFQQHLSGPITLEDFTGRLSYGRFHTMSIDNLIAILAKSDTFRVVTDAKEANIRVLTQIAELYPDYIDRFVPQIYDYEEYETVKNLGYQDIILTLYRMPAPKVDEIQKFYEEKGLFGITIVDEDYIEKIAQKLAKRGVKIYRHPVSNFERYQELLEKGYYGIYTSSILPREVAGPNADYYITVTDEHGKTIKLTDYDVQGDTVEEVVALEVHGIVENEYRIYYIGDEGQRMTNQGLDELAYGKTHMPVEIWKVDDRFVGHYTGRTLDYYIWKDENGVRILDAKYEYRADNRRVIPKLESLKKAASAGSTDDPDFDAYEILSQSYIAHAGDYYYYVNSDSGSFMLEDEFFYATYGDGENAETDGGTEVYVPVAETAIAMGGFDIGMDGDENIIVRVPKLFSGRDIRTDLAYKETPYTWHYMASRNAYPYMPFLQKTLVSGKYMGGIFGRVVLEGSGDTAGILVILPASVNAEDITPNQQTEILNLAAQLYK